MGRGKRGRTTPLTELRTREVVGIINQDRLGKTDATGVISTFIYEVPGYICIRISANTTVSNFF